MIHIVCVNKVLLNILKLGNASTKTQTFPRVITTFIDYRLNVNVLIYNIFLKTIERFFSPEVIFL